MKVHIRLFNHQITHALVRNFTQTLYSFFFSNRDEEKKYSKTCIRYVRNKTITKTLQCKDDQKLISSIITTHLATFCFSFSTTCCFSISSTLYFIFAARCLSISSTLCFSFFTTLYFSIHAAKTFFQTQYSQTRFWKAKVALILFQLQYTHTQICFISMVTHFSMLSSFFPSLLIPFIF